jgi:hypothetical protein
MEVHGEIFVLYNITIVIQRDDEEKDKPAHRHNASV